MLLGILSPIWREDAHRGDTRLSLPLTHYPARSEHCQRHQFRSRRTHGRDLYRLFHPDQHWANDRVATQFRSEEHTSELQSLMRISYAVFCLKKKKPMQHPTYTY